MVTDNEKTNCKKKTRYKSENEAKQSIDRLRLKIGNKSLRIYRCPVCLSFHITSKPKR